MKTRDVLILSAVGFCLALGMLWLLGGLTTPVAAAPRLQVVEGACCACDGRCFENVTQDWCEDVALGGYHGGKSCEEVSCVLAAQGACCLPDGSCENVTESCCTDFLGGTFHPGLGNFCDSVECPAPAVGGMTAPVNGMALLLPWVFLTAMVVTGTIVAVLLKLHVA